MRKRIKFRKLGRTPSHRHAMLRNLVTSLIEHERIITTTAKAKEMRRLAERMITIAKKPNKLNARRAVGRVVRTDLACTKLMRVLGPRYEFRNGGYTRIMKLAKPRLGDRADMSVIEYVDRPGEIRAARPPKALRQIQSLDELLQKLGLEDSKMAEAARKVQEEQSEGKNENNAAGVAASTTNTTFVVEQQPKREPIDVSKE